MSDSTLRKWIGGSFLFLLMNSAYIWAFAVPTVFYMGNVLLHLGAGTALFFASIIMIRRRRERLRGISMAGLFFGLAFLLGALLAWKGNTTEHRWALLGHIGAALLGTAALIPVIRRMGKPGGGRAHYQKAFIAAFGLLILLPPSVAAFHRIFPDPRARIVNSETAPLSMFGEGGGPNSPFFPSSARTNVGGIIPSNFFMDSKTCGECHKDIYEQWNSSAHHFGSFNNQFYRKSVEYMQSVVGTRPSKWCAGCHDHAVFFNGRFERPISEQIDTPEARAGLACTSCHAIVRVEGSVGNGGFTVEYPALHQYMTSKNKYIRSFNHFLTYLNPEPHKRSFMKPFMRADSAEFCSTCHKVHLDVPVNQYRWFRGFNDYDNWQASGVSGQGARSFYYPNTFSVCRDCHMPLVASADPGNQNGKVHSHRFPGANTALPTVNGDPVQLKTVEDFLTSGFITADIFAVSPVEESRGQTPMVRRLGEGPRIQSTFGVGEEAEQSDIGIIREVGKVAAPMDQAGVRLRPGSTVRVDVVVRTRKIGHFFPGGTVDAFDIWLELQGRDAAGTLIYWSGRVQDDLQVEPGAHFYRSYQLDGEGNPINKRNAWQTRSVLYVRLIPPGAADVAHFRVQIPADMKGPITFTAKLNYRKFSQYYTEFAYAGQPKTGQDPALVGPAFDNRQFSFEPGNIPRNVSGNIKDRIPVLPIVVLAQAQTKIDIGDSKTETQWEPVVRKQDRERWNDWGIGLLLQGDLKGAEYAFRKATEAEPTYADGWLNVARALISEGETEAAKPFIEKALAVNDTLGRIHYFKALIQKADGDYDGALRSLRTTLSNYPRDRVVLNQVARILFLKRQYKEALDALKQVNAVDPEDLQMHYTAMLCYRGLGNLEAAAREQQLFQRFKAEEAAQSLTEKPRLISPENNNERQQIHDHESVPLTGSLKRFGSTESGASQ